MKALLLNLDPLRFVALNVLRRLSGKFCYRGPFSTVKLADIPEPSLPSPQWVKIKTRLCGLCGSDINLMFMKDSPSAMPFTSFPCVPGHEFCGEVVETGAQVKNVKKGDLVTVVPELNCITRGIEPVCRSCASVSKANCENYAEGSISPGMFIGICRDINGGFAEYVVAHESQVYVVPAGVTPESASLVEPLAVGLQAVLDNRPADTNKVLIIGGGVIGVMVVKSIRGLGIGCDITVVEPSAFAAQYVKKCGANRTISGGIIEAAASIAGGRVYKPELGERMVMGGFDKVYDTVANSDTLNKALRVTVTQGVLSVIGIGKSVKLDLTPTWLKVQTIKGCYGYRSNNIAGTQKHAFEIALDLIASKKIQVDDMLTHKFPLEKYREMIEVNLSKEANRAIKTAVCF
jgi:threonine dehydrogenase-like Zn-dependent dehydrogenase